MSRQFENLSSVACTPDEFLRRRSFARVLLHVLFEKREDVVVACASENKRNEKYNNVSLLRKCKEEYQDEKMYESYYQTHPWQIKGCCQRNSPVTFQSTLLYALSETQRPQRKTSRGINRSEYTRT